MKILKLKAWNEKQKASYGNHNEIQGKVFSHHHVEQNFQTLDEIVHKLRYNLKTEKKIFIRSFIPAEFKKASLVFLQFNL